MIVRGVESGPALAALAATVLPAPTSPQTTPSARSVMIQLILATASWWAAEANSIEGASSLVNGVRDSPQCALSRSILIRGAPFGRRRRHRLAGRVGHGNRSAPSAPARGACGSDRGSRSPSAQMVQLAAARAGGRDA